MPSGCKFAGIFGVKDGGASYFLEPGPDPSAGWIVVMDADVGGLTYNPDGHTLDLASDIGPQSVKHLFVTSIEDAGAGITRITFADSRLLWKRRTVTKIYNQMMPDGTTFNSKTTKNSLDSEGWTFEEIIKDLCDAITTNEGGNFKPTVTLSPGLSKIDTASRPLIRNAHWECYSAAAAVQACMNLVGGHISIDFDGNIRVSLGSDSGSTAWEGAIQQNYDQKSASAKTPFAVDKPDKIKFKWRTLRDKMFKKTYWEPVLQHDGRDSLDNEASELSEGKYRAGEWGPAEDVLKEWGFDLNKIKKEWGRLEQVYAEPKWKLRRVALIKDQLYRFFRYKPPTTTSTEARLQILPFHSQRGTIAEMIDGSPLYAQPHCKDAKTFISMQTGDSAQVKEIDLDPSSVKIVDQEQGIIEFATSNPVCKISGSGLVTTDIVLDDYDFSVMIPYIKKFTTSDPNDDYYEYEVSDSWSGVKGNGQTEEILDTSQYYVERDATGSGTFTGYNESDLETYADLYAEDYFKEWGAKFKQSQMDWMTVGYITQAKYLDGRLLHMEVGWDGNAGPFQRFRFGSEAPLNPYSKNYVHDRGEMQATGQTIDTTSRSLIARRGGSRGIPDVDSHRHRGIMEYCTDLGKRHYMRQYQIPPTFINPMYYGLVVAEDLVFSEERTATVAGGEDPKDYRTKHCRIHEIKSSGAPSYDRVKKYDETYAFGREVWEAVLVSEPIDDGGGAVGTPAPAPVITTGGVGDQAEGSGQRPGCSGGGLTQSLPATPTAPAPTPTGTKSEKAANKSTYVFTGSPEGKKGHKGALNDVLMVGQHRSYGEDPDENKINRLEIDKIRAYLHKEKTKGDVMCGPLADDGRKKQPVARGYDQYAAQIYDPRTEDWRYYARFDGGSIPAPPEPTPAPGPGPTPNPPLPPVVTGDPQPPGGGGGGGNPPGGGGGGGSPPGGGAPPPGGGGAPPGGFGGGFSGPGDGPFGGGFGNGPMSGGSEPVPGPTSLPPVITPPPTAGPVLTGGGRPSGGSPDLDDIGHEIGHHMGRVSRGGGFPSPPAVPTEVGTPIPADDPPMRNPGSRWAGKDRWGNPIEDFTPSPRSIPLADHIALNPMTANYTLGAWQRTSAYTPGTNYGTNTYPLNQTPRGGSPYCPGGSSWTRLQELAFALGTPASDHSWGATAIAADQISNTDYLNSTHSGLLKSAAETANTALARIHAIDSRIRANYPKAETATMLNGNNTVNFTTTHPYTAQPCITMTPYGPLGAMSISSSTQNADGTWTIAISSESAAIGDVPIDVNVKGSVADSTDIDP